MEQKVENFSTCGLGLGLIPDIGPADLCGTRHSTMAQFINTGTAPAMSKPSWNITRTKHMLCHQESHYKINLTEILVVKKMQGKNGVRTFQLLENEATQV